MRSLRTRLVLSHILPLLVVLLLVGAALTYLLETQVLLVESSNELERQATLVAVAAEYYPEIWSDPLEAQLFALRIRSTLSARVMFLDAQGTLIASTDLDDVAALGTQPDVPGFATMLLTGEAVSVGYGDRAWAGLVDILLPVFSSDGKIVGAIRLTDPLSNVYARFPKTRTFIMWVLIGGALAGIAVGWFLALDLERPLRRAAQAISQMATGQPLSPLEERGPHEIRLLFRAFNTLAARLQDSEKARRRLLANLVHELGRPLGALRAATQALSGGAAEDGALRTELLDGMDAEMVRMQRLLDELTHLYDQTVGPLELERKATALSGWLAQMVVPWREAALEKELHWQAELPTDLPTVMMDPDRMAQAVGNVLSNAVKYTPKDGRVDVAAGATEKEAWIRVADTGPGIPPEELDRIFTPFYRGGTGQRFPQGLGLGLSIARDFVEAHGGRIEVASEPGTGSTFTLYLPLS